MTSTFNPFHNNLYPTPSIHNFPSSSSPSPTPTPSPSPSPGPHLPPSLLQNLTTGTDNSSSTVMAEVINMTTMSYLPPHAADDVFPVPPDVAIQVLARFHLIAVPAIVILGVLGNVLSFGIFISKTLRRTSCSLYLAARCLSDTGFLLFVFITWLGDAMGVPVIHTVVVCQVVVFTSYVFGFLSVWLVVCITLENYIRICHPFSVCRYCTVQKARRVMVALVILSVAIYQFPLWTTHVTTIEKGQQYCGNKVEFIEIFQVLVYSDMIITLVLPSVLIIFFMVAICVSLVHSLKRQSRLKGSSRRVQPPPNNIPPHRTTTATTTFATFATPTLTSTPNTTTTTPTTTTTCDGTLNGVATATPTTPTPTTPTTTTTTTTTTTRADTKAHHLKRTINQCQEEEARPHLDQVDPNRRHQSQDPILERNPDPDQDQDHASLLQPDETTKGKTSHNAPANNPTTTVGVKASKRRTPRAPLTITLPAAAAAVKTTASAGGGGGGGGGGAPLRAANRRSVRGSAQAKVTRLLFAVSFTFLVLSLPSHIVRLRMMMLMMVEQTSSLSPSLEEMLQVVFQILYYLSFAVNLLVYLTCGESFRNVFLETYITCFLGRQSMRSRRRRRSELSRTSYSMVKAESPTATTMAAAETAATEKETSLVA